MAHHLAFALDFANLVAITDLYEKNGRRPTISLFGGVGTIWGTIIGALIIGVLNNGLDLLNVSAYWQTIIKGSIIVVAVIIDERKNR